MTSTQLARPTLVIVDDESDVLRSLYDQFRIDYHIETFTQPAEALRYLAENDAGVVMSDQRMPTITGVDFLKAAKKVRPDATRLLFTGYSDIRAVIDAINEGSVFRYIAKPWDYNELAAIIQQAFHIHDLVVDRRRAVEELREANIRLKEANRVKAAFIEVASHELNTPVAVVLGLTDLWRMSQGENPSAEERSWVDRIHRAGKRLAGTVDRMLKLVRAEDLDHTLDLRPTDLCEMLRLVVDEMQPFLAARDQEFEVRIEPGLGTAVIDVAKLSDVLLNLLGNAIKFTPDGRTITIVGESEGLDHVRFRVIDPGVGINIVDRRHLFEPFFTSCDTLHHSSGEYQYCKRGIGLGLHMVKRFVEMHGGRIEVISAPQQGTTFSVTIPRHPPILEASCAAG